MGFAQPAPGLMAPALTQPFLPGPLQRFPNNLHNFSLYRTPSGKYYCHLCNLSLQSELHLAQHFDSKRHKFTKKPDILSTPANGLHLTL